FDGIVPSAEKSELDKRDDHDLAEYRTHLDGLLLHEAVDEIVASAVRGNEYIQTTQPWALAKLPEKREELEDVLGGLARSIARQAVMMFPFMPTKAAEMWQSLGGPGRVEDQRL